MESSLKKLDQNKYELAVEVGKEELVKYLELAESRISHKTKINGFRKGKAPREMIHKEVGDQPILEEALDLALRDSLTKTIDKEGLEVLKVDDLSIKENSASKLFYTVRLALFPSVTIGGLKDLKIKRREITIERKDIDDALEFLRVSRSKFISKDKPIERGDRVEIDFEVTSGGLPIEGGMSRNHPLVVGDNKFIPGFEEQLIGLKHDEEKTFSLTAPKDYFYKNIAGKNLDFKVKISSVQVIQKPELTDSFVKTLGRFETLKDLESNISEGILVEKKAKEEQRVRIELLAAILDKSKINVPNNMVEERLDDMMTNFDNELHAKGMELSLYLAHLNKTNDDLRKDWLSEAKKQVSFSLILKKIAKDRNISPTPQEIEEAASQIIQGAALRGEVNQENIDIENLKEVAAVNLINEKVFSFLEENCVM